MSYSRMAETDKQRLAAAFINAKNPKDLMNKIDWDTAATDFKPTGTAILGVSFKTGITRMKRTYAALSASDKQRMAAGFVNITPSALKSIMANINWGKATKDFKPSGKSITAASFRTSIARMLKDTGDAGTPAPGRKRKAATTDDSATESASKSGRSKKAKTAQAQEELEAGDSDGTAVNESKVVAEASGSSGRAREESAGVKTEQDTDWLNNDGGSAQAPMSSGHVREQSVDADAEAKAEEDTITNWLNSYDASDEEPMF